MCLKVRQDSQGRHLEREDCVKGRRNRVQQSEKQVQWLCRESRKSLESWASKSTLVVVGSNYRGEQQDMRQWSRWGHMTLYLIDHGKEFALYFKCDETTFQALSCKVMQPGSHLTKSSACSVGNGLLWRWGRGRYKEKEASQETEQANKKKTVRADMGKSGRT